MSESPLFTQIKSEGTVSTNPLRESFVNPENRRLVLIALFGATAGQGVVWYTGQFYALYFLQTVMMIQGGVASKIIACALLLGTPFFILFGFLSDRIGRKKLMMAGCLLGALLYIPIYSAMQATIPDTQQFRAPTTTIEASTDPVTKKEVITRVDTFAYGDVTKVVKTPSVRSGSEVVPKAGEKAKTEITPNVSIFWTLAGLVFLQVLFVTMVYGPIAAFLVELFPTRIRYTSMSLPYHIGNGVFGGLVPLIGTKMVDVTGNKLSGLWFPIAIASLTFIVGSIMITERKGKGGFEEIAP
jgi:MHS family proline/betaine transporter-like MFS transporter